MFRLPRSCRSDRRRARTAFAQSDVIALIVLVLVFAVVVFALHTVRFRSPGPGRRNVCAANLKGLATGFYTYANENNDIWPIVPHLPADAAGTGRVHYAPGRIGQDRDRGTTEADTDVSVTRNLWMLVRFDMALPAMFVCPNSGDQPNRDANPKNYWDFASYSQISYGYQVPFGLHGQPSGNCDLRMAIAADKGPYSAALEAGAAHPGAPTADLNSSDRDWRSWNSPNHGGEGQNVLHADGSASWIFTPLGTWQDNIYTRWSDPTGGGAQSPQVRVQGTPPTSNETPFSDTDSLIYP